MPTRTRHPILLLALTALVLLAGASTLTGSALARGGAKRATRSAVSVHRLLVSRALWATIDVCNAPDQANTVGVRGSMPGDGQPGDRMYMSFRLQYLDATTSTWVDLLSGATPSYVALGGGATARQGGRSFQLVPVAGRPAVTLRGVVDFQWRHGATVLASAARPTTVGHMALAGADPAGYSAASCVIG